MPLKSLNRASDHIEIIAERGRIGVRELSKTTGLPPASTHRIIAALFVRGYLSIDQRNHQYPLSPKFSIPGENVQKQETLVISNPNGIWTSDSLDPATLPATMPQHVFVCMMANLVELHAAADKLGHEKVASVYEFDNLTISERWWLK